MRQGTSWTVRSRRTTGSPSTISRRPESSWWTTLREIPELVRATPRGAAAWRSTPRPPRCEPHDAELVGLSLAASPTEVWYLPFAHRPLPASWRRPAPVKNLPPLGDPAIAPLVELLTDPAVRKAGHNIKYDWQVLRGAGVELAGVAYDSMLASFVLDPGRRSHAIDTLSLEHLGRAMQTYADVAGEGEGADPVRRGGREPAAAAYCGADSATVLALHDVLRARRSRETGDRAAAPRDRDAARPVLADMEWEGIAIDRGLFARLSDELGADLRRAGGATSRRWPACELNLNSPRQLATVLFEKHQLPVLKRTKTGPSTDADVLEQLAAMGHELPRLILEYRELQKLKSTYVDTLPQRVNRRTGRIHTSFNQTGAATGRLSSSDPNLQNIPVRTPRGEAIRRGFVPRAGWTLPRGRLLADRAAAHGASVGGSRRSSRRSGRAGTSTGRRRRSSSASRSTQVTPEMRGRAKTINFATIYGQGPFALSRQLGISQEEAKAFIARYFERFAGVRAFLDGRCSLRGSRATWRRSSGAAATSPRSATATSTCAPTASATRRTRRSRARPPTSSSSP